jgi:hypothetical protein
VRNKNEKSIIKNISRIIAVVMILLTIAACSSQSKPKETKTTLEETPLATKTPKITETPIETEYKDNNISLELYNVEQSSTILEADFKLKNIGPKKAHVFAEFTVECKYKRRYIPSIPRTPRKECITYSKPWITSTLGVFSLIKLNGNALDSWGENDFLKSNDTIQGHVSFSDYLHLEGNASNISHEDKEVEICMTSDVGDIVFLDVPYASVFKQSSFSREYKETQHYIVSKFVKVSLFSSVVYSKR